MTLDLEEETPELPEVNFLEEPTGDYVETAVNIARAPGGHRAVLGLGQIKKETIHRLQ